MYSDCMKFSRIAILSPALALLAVSSLWSQQGQGRPGGGAGAAAAAAPAAGAPAAPMANPLPADAHVAQSVEVGGKSVKYTATVGTLPVKNAEGKAIAEVVFTSYIVDEPEPAGHLRLQRRPRRGQRLSQPRRHRAQARATSAPKARAPAIPPP